MTFSKRSCCFLWGAFSLRAKCYTMEADDLEELTTITMEGQNYKAWKRFNQVPHYNYPSSGQEHIKQLRSIIFLWQKKKKQNLMVLTWCICMLLVEASSNQVRQKNDPSFSAKTVKQHHMKFVEFYCLDMCSFEVVSSKVFVQEAKSETLAQVFNL